MATRRIARNGYYVYAIFHSDGVTPFYIGKGGEDRWLRHERDAHMRRTPKELIIHAMQNRGLPIIKSKISEGLTNAEANRLEMDMIQLVGRRPVGPLVNGTAGGDGVSLSPDDLAKRNAAIRAAYQTPQGRKKALAAAQKRNTPELAEKLSAALKGKRKSAKQRSNFKKAWSDPDIRAARMASLKKSITPELIAKRAEGLKRAWADPEKRARMMRRFSPEVMAKSVPKMIASMATPEVRAKQSAAGKKGSASKWAKWRAQNTLPSENDAQSNPPNRIPGPPHPSLKPPWPQ